MNNFKYDPLNNFNRTQLLFTSMGLAENIAAVYIISWVSQLTSFILRTLMASASIAQAMSREEGDQGINPS